jgi:hypothetical protein
MTKPMIRIHNAETDEIIDREMNDDEFAAYSKLQAETAARIADEQRKAEAKTALLERLGITADEAALLLK